MEPGGGCRAACNVLTGGRRASLSYIVARPRRITVPGHFLLFFTVDHGQQGTGKSAAFGLSSLAKYSRSRAINNEPVRYSLRNGGSTFGVSSPFHPFFVCSVTIE